MNLHISEQLSYATVRIECITNDNYISTGSGFIFNFKDNEQQNTQIPVLITNKHVIRNTKEGKIIFSQKNAHGEADDKNHFSVSIKGFEKLWIMHPDEDVDLCAMPIGPLVHQAAELNQELFYVSLSTALIPNGEQLNSLSAMEEIVMVGYPNGLWDSVNNKPIFRKGVTATHPRLDYNGKKEFMIDASCIPGSSGSPVFLVNENGYSDRNGNMYLGAKRVMLLGILYAGPQLTTQGEIKVFDVPTAQRAFSVVNIPINLGLVIKSERILELENVF